MYAIYTVSYSLAIQYCIRLILFVCSFLTLRQKWASFALLVVSGSCFFGAAFGLFNAWQVFLIVIIFYISKSTLTILLIKLYFLK